MCDSAEWRGGPRDGEEQENVMTRRRKKVRDSGSGPPQQGPEPVLQRGAGAQLCLAPGTPCWQDWARKAARGDGIPS